MSMEQWWDDTDRGQPKYSEDKLSQWHSVQQKSQRGRPGIEHGHRSEFKNYI